MINGVLDGAADGVGWSDWGCAVGLAADSTQAVLKNRVKTKIKPIFIERLDFMIPPVESKL